MMLPGIACGDLDAPLRRLRSTLPGELSAQHSMVLGMRVGGDRFDVVHGRLGEAVAFSPEAAPELLSTCFIDSDSSFAVMFQAQRRDPHRRLTMAYIGSSSALDRSARRCQRLSGLAQSAAAGSGIALGMSREAFAARFPHAPSERTARVLGYYYFQPLEGQCQLLSGLRAEFGPQGLAAVTVYRLYRGADC
jgi:hypothetical protein